jgi:hypothetical protein
MLAACTLVGLSAIVTIDCGPSARPGPRRHRQARRTISSASRNADSGAEPSALLLITQKLG